MLSCLTTPIRLELYPRLPAASINFSSIGAPHVDRCDLTCALAVAYGRLCVLIAFRPRAAFRRAWLSTPDGFCLPTAFRRRRLFAVRGFWTPAAFVFQRPLAVDGFSPRAALDANGFCLPTAFRRRRLFAVRGFRTSAAFVFQRPLAVDGFSPCAAFGRQRLLSSNGL